MLGSKKSKFGGTTLISQGTVIVGDIHFSGSLDIEGLVQGNIIAQSGKEASVRVVDKGRVEGEINAPTVIINGTVDGDVRSTKHLELASRGRVRGNVLYALLEMAAGSEVNGSLSHLDRAAVTAGEEQESALDGVESAEEVAEPEADRAKS